MEMQTDRQYKALTDPSGPFRLTVAGTGQVTPYTDAEELIVSVPATRIFEVTTSAADRAHPLLEGAVGGVCPEAVVGDLWSAFPVDASPRPLIFNVPPVLVFAAFIPGKASGRIWPAHSHPTSTCRQA
jgi:hypothetical protein